MYHFITLSEEQVAQRRVLLDWYANLAQFSALVPLLAVQGYFLASLVAQKLTRRSAEDIAPRSPHGKDLRPHRLFAAGELQLRGRRFAWWCGDSLDVFGLHVGTKGEVLLAGAWMAWLLTLCFLQTGEGS